MAAPVWVRGRELTPRSGTKQWAPFALRERGPKK